MVWKDWSYWLKGLCVGIVYITITYSSYLLLVSDLGVLGILGFFFIFPAFFFGPYLGFSIMSGHNFRLDIITIVFWIAFFVIIGWIIGKIKSQNTKVN